MFKIFKIKRLRNEFSVYMTKDSRICIAGMTSKQNSYVAYAFNQVTK